MEAETEEMKGNKKSIDIMIAAAENMAALIDNAAALGKAVIKLVLRN